MSIHSEMSPSNGRVHAPFDFLYADATARIAATYLDFTALDVRKFACQLSDNSVWMLADIGSGSSDPVWVRVSYPAGTIIQSVIIPVSPGGAISTSGTTYVDATGMTGTITPQFTTSKILVRLTGGLYYSSGVVMSVKLFGGTAGTTDLGIVEVLAGQQEGPHAIAYIDSPSSISAQIYKFQFKSQDASTVYFHYDLAGFAGVGTGYPPVLIELLEIAV